MEDSLENVEKNILTSLSRSNVAMDLDALVKSVRVVDQGVRAVDVKIAALDLVSKGKVVLDDIWQLTPIKSSR